MFLTRDEEPDAKRIEELIKRPEMDRSGVESAVRSILWGVKERGDSALCDYEKRFDHASLSSLRVSEEEIAEAAGKVPPALKEAIAHAARNITSFHKAEMPSGEKVEVEKGVKLSRIIVPIEKVGLYVPGGSAPLFSTVLMLSIPARVAGCSQIVLCTPPGADGKVNPAILWAAKEGGVTAIYKAGGAQAIAAMAYGTETIPRVDKIFGPGNRYVTEAKLQIASHTAIDMPAGPSEVMVIADPSTNPVFVASDLMSQAEHGADSQAMLVVVGSGKEASSFLDKVEDAIAEELSSSPRKAQLEGSLSHSHAFVMHTKEGAALVANAYAPEHLIISARNYRDILPLIRNAGSVFLGPWSCESAGDYASGTNHTLPTGGWARSYGGVSVDTYLKKMTVQELSEEGLENLSGTIVAMARGESLECHARAVICRVGEKE